MDEKPPVLLRKSVVVPHWLFLGVVLNSYITFPVCYASVYWRSSDQSVDSLDELVFAFVHFAGDHFDGV